MKDYKAQAHAMQSGVAAKMNYDGSEIQPKHLRVGINAAMSDMAGLVKLLMDKGVFTREEFETYITASMADEVASYERWLSERTGGTITLA